MTPAPVPASYTFKAINTLNKETMILRVADKDNADMAHAKALYEFRRFEPEMRSYHVALKDVTAY